MEAVLDEVHTLTERVEGLDAHVADLAATVERLDEGVDADGVVHEADTLTEWVDEWLAPTFALATELHGWADLPGAQVMLAALHKAHQAATSAKAHPVDEVAFYTTPLPRVVVEIGALRDRTTAERARARNAGLRSIR